MFAVVFEVLPSETGYQRYLDIAAALRPKLDAIDGFVSIERFKSITDPGWILSLSLWRDQAALIRWRSDGEHHAAQAEGRRAIFNDYRIRVVRMVNADEQVQEIGEQQALIGFWEYPELTNHNAGKRYQSLVNAGKHIALFDFSSLDTALAWQTSVAAAPPAHVLCGVVERDYGLFERQQAPQHFPDAGRHR